MWLLCLLIVLTACCIGLVWWGTKVDDYLPWQQIAGGLGLIPVALLGWGCAGNLTAIHSEVIKVPAMTAIVPGAAVVSWGDHVWLFRDAHNVDLAKAGADTLIQKNYNLYGCLCVEGGIQLSLDGESWTNEQ